MKGLFKKASSYTYSKTHFVHQIARSNQNEILNNMQLNNFGLTKNQVEEIQKKYGKNTISKVKFHWMRQLLKNIFNPFNLILIIIATYNLYTYLAKDKDMYKLIGTIIVLSMVFISTTINYTQEIITFLSSRKLTKIVSNTATVIRSKNRDDKITEINQDNSMDVIKKAHEVQFQNLVPGDLIYLSSGDMLPCDVRILWSKDLFINQSSLTGESLSVEKHATDNQKANILEYENICYMGTSVISGSAIAISINTGQNTYFAMMSQIIKNTSRPDSFQSGLRRISFILIGLIIVLTPIVLAISGFKKGDWSEALFFTLAVVVGLTPEMMPIILTTNLTRGAIKMSRYKVVVKQLSAIQKLGAINILCTDKTGTLTQDKIELVNYFDLENKNNPKLLQYLYLNSYSQTGLKNQIDRSVIEYFKQKSANTFKELYHKIDEIPYDFHRRRLSIIVNDQQNEHLLICKGAAEEILSICSKVEYQGKIVPLTDHFKKIIISRILKMNDQGLRVIALSYKKGHSDNNYYDITDERNLIFLGFATFLDLPKPSSKDMIKGLQKKGIDLKILTGDNEKVTKAICQRVGLNITGIISGEQLEKLSDQKLYEQCIKCNVFVKLSPIQKAQIIKVLQDNNNRVGFMGDGINDVPVLKQSDVAISVNNATDIAKDASDIILLEKSLGVLEAGIIEGRRTFANILKYIKITLASNFGNVFSIIIALLWIPFEPISSLQLLLQNLLYDFSQFTIAFDRVDNAFLNQPQNWTKKNLFSFVFTNGIVSSIFDIIMLIILGYFFNTIRDQNITLFQTGWFISGLLTQILIVQMLRTTKIPIIQNRSPAIIYIMILFIMAIGITIPFTTIGTQLGMVGPPLIYFAFLTLIIVSYCLATQFTKWVYIKIFKQWI